MKAPRHKIVYMRPQGKATAIDELHDVALQLIRDVGSEVDPSIDDNAAEGSIDVLWQASKKYFYLNLRADGLCYFFKGEDITQDNTVEGVGSINSYHGWIGRWIDAL
jgi:hypothetical protein